MGGCGGRRVVGIGVVVEGGAVVKGSGSRTSMGVVGVVVLVVVVVEGVVAGLAVRLSTCHHLAKTRKGSR